MDLNKSNIKKILLIIIFTATIFWLFNNFDVAFNVLSLFAGITSPLIIGLCLAFILNVPMRGIENKLFNLKYIKSKKSEKIINKVKRPLSILITILVFLLSLTLISLLIIPQISNTFEIIKSKMPAFFKSVSEIILPLLKETPNLNELFAEIKFDWANITQSIIDFFQTGFGDVFSQTVNIASSVFSGVFNGVIGFVFAIYILSQKEKLTSQFKKLFTAYLPYKKSTFLFKLASTTNKTFSKFVCGQCLEAVILGLLFFITMTIFGFPYELMISVLIAVTALIPMFGAFIGCGIGAFLILVSNPAQAFWFVVLFLILQQIEGNLIYPRVVGTSVGLPSIWVLVAVTIGGGLFGVVGMLISVPAVSILYSLLREHVNAKLLVKEKELKSK